MAVHESLLMTIGAENQAAQKWSGVPFNRPTQAVVSANTGDVYISDGYGNSRVHRFSSEGKHVVSWGSPGCEPGEFQRPHNVVIDEDEIVYVADRENNRVQVFDKDGKIQAVWLSSGRHVHGAGRHRPGRDIVRTAWRAAWGRTATSTWATCRTR